MQEVLLTAAVVGGGDEVMERWEMLVVVGE